jgi:hypothetical protein
LASLRRRKQCRALALRAEAKIGSLLNKCALKILSRTRPEALARVFLPSVLERVDLVHRQISLKIDF